MRRQFGRSAVQAVLLSLLCVAPAACDPSGRFMSRGGGGVYMVLAVKADPPALEQSLTQATRVIEMRCTYLGVYCKAERQGGAGPNRIGLQVSGAQDFAHVKAVLLAEGKLELRPVASRLSPMPLTTYPTREAAEKEAGSQYDVVPYEEEDGSATQFLTVEREPVVTGLDLRSAEALPKGRDEGDGYQIAFTLRPEGAARFGTWTSANVGRYLAIVLNGKVRSVPYIKSQITDTGQIDGNFTRLQAEDIALTLKSGNMPTTLEVLEERPYKP